MNESEQTRERIAIVYAQAMQRKYGAQRGHDGIPKEVHYRFAEAVIDRHAYGLEYLANGHNDAAKSAFTAITGLALPKTQAGCWKVIREWAGISDEMDAVNQAIRSVEMQVRALDGRFSNFADGRKWIKERLESGFATLINTDSKWMLVNGEGKGFNLSKRGCRLSRLRPLISAEIKLLQARTALAKKEMEITK